MEQVIRGGGLLQVADGRGAVLHVGIICCFMLSFGGVVEPLTMSGVFAAPSVIHGYLIMRRRHSAAPDDLRHSPH